MQTFLDTKGKKETVVKQIKKMTTQCIIIEFIPEKSICPLGPRHLPSGSKKLALHFPPAMESIAHGERTSKDFNI